MLCTKNKPKAIRKNKTYRNFAIFFLKDKAKPTKNKHQIEVKNQGSSILNSAKSIFWVKILVKKSKLINGIIERIIK